MLVKTLAVAGALTPAGALTKQVGRLLAGALAPSGVLVRRTARGLVAALTPAATIAHSLAVSRAGAITPTGVLGLVRVRLLALLGAITPTGTFTQPRTNVSETGTLAPTATIESEIVPVVVEPEELPEWLPVTVPETPEFVLR
jgi:hypothetical protein